MRRVLPLALVPLVVLVLSMLITACETGSQSATDTKNLPAGVPPVDGNKLPTDIQQLKIAVANGKFDQDRYEMQKGAVQLVISVAGGPYTFSVPRLIAAQDLPADKTTTIGVNVPDPGDYTLTLQDAGTATLHVRAPGGP